MKLPRGPGGTGRDPWLLAREAEQLGFESVWAGEHHVIPGASTSANVYYPTGVPAMPDPLIGLAAAAAVTRSLKVGTSVLLAVQRNPLLLAKEISTLDADCGGRLEVGIGLGWNREECEVMGGDFRHRVAQLKEAVQVMKLLWTEEFVEFHGEFYDFPPVKSSPGPYTRPHPPILLGMHTEESLERVVDYADGWLEAVTRPEQLRKEGIEHITWGRARLTKLAAEAGRDPDAIIIRVMLIDRDGSVDKGLIAQYVAAGADHIHLLGSPMPTGILDTDQGALDWLRRLADRVVDR
jgi:probable F420-dependent oxidoreductase